MMKGMTTIEFCEKTTRQPSLGETKLTSYDRGCLDNLLNVFGPNPLLWLLPVSLPTGEGLYFPAKGSAEGTEGADGVVDSAADRKSDPEWTTTSKEADTYTRKQSPGKSG